MRVVSLRICLSLVVVLGCGRPASAQVVEQVTPAGVRVWQFPDDDADRFVVAAIVGVGSRDEDPAHAGIAHFLEHVLFLPAGPQRLQVAHEELDGRGIDFNGYTSSECTVYHLTGAPEHWRFMVDWLAEHLLRPRLDPGQVERERRIVLQEIATTGPDFRDVTLDRLLYGDHALARSIGGFESTVEAVTIDDLRAFHRRHYHAGNLAIGFAGRVSGDSCMVAVHQAFADVAPAPDPAAMQQAAPLPGSGAPSRNTGDLWGFPGVDGRGSFGLGWHLSCTEPAQLRALLVVEQHLGARFFAVAREERQLAYAPSVELTWGRDAQRLQFACDTGTRDDVTELAKVAEGLVRDLGALDESAVERAVGGALARFEVESASQLAAAMELAFWVTGRGERLDEFEQALAKTSSADVAAVAERLLRRDRVYSTSNVLLFAVDRQALAMFVLWTVAVIVVLKLRGRRMWQALRGWWGRRRRRRKRGAVLPMPVRGPITPVDVDAVERDIQRFLADEDRASGER